MKKLLLLASLLIVASLIAQTPCNNGMAGIYPCNKFDLLSEMTASEFGSNNANDSWGWTDPDTGSEYVLLGLNDGTAFLNIDDPVNPIYLGRLNTHTGTSIWRDIKTYANYAFIVSEASNHGMQVFDLTRLRNVTNPPVIFDEDAHYDGFGNAHNVVINEAEGYAYAVGSTTFNGGPHFVDITNPLNPVAAGGFSTDFYSHDGQVIIYNGPDTDYTGREIYVGSNESFISIVDITDKSNPISISTATYPNTVYTHQGWFTEDHAYFLLGDEIDEINIGFNTRTIVFDFSDLDNPQLHFQYSGPTPATDHNGYVRDNIFYLANYAAGIRAINVENIENQEMTEVGYFDIHPTSEAAGYDGAWNVYPYFESGTILISTLNFNNVGFVPGMFLIRANTTLSTQNFDSLNVTIYPNPASDFVTISDPDRTISKMALYDITGKLLFETQDSNITTIDVSSYSQGMYFLRINDRIAKQLIVE